MTGWRASAPGKVILMGEHAAVYGRPAVVAAVGLRLTATLEELGAEDPVRLEVPDLAARENTTWREILAYTREARRRWRAYSQAPSREAFHRLRGDDPIHLVKIALGEGLAEPLGNAPRPPAVGVRLSISSEIPVGSGFGSSAAVAAAVLGVLDAWRGRPVSPDSLRERALEAERRQHGLPSGVDTATVLAGGILWAERRGESPEGVLATVPVEASPDLLRRFTLFDTGPPAEPTGSVVAEVRAMKEEAPHRVEGLLERMEEATRAFRRSLAGDGGGDDPVPAIKSFQRCLEELGVVPREVQRSIRQIEAAGGGAKISGAGSLAGPGAGSLLVYHPDPEAVSHWPFLSELRRFDVPFGDAGIRIEPPI